jgi:signal peptidase II
VSRVGALALAALVATVDQATKAVVVATLPFGYRGEVLPGLFRLVHNRNRGIAFGVFGGAGEAGRWVLVALILAIAAFVAWQLVRARQATLAATGLALVLGGALGNLADRLLRGEVVDFLELYVRAGGRELAWPAFNVADAGITCGAVAVVIAEILAERRARRAADAH